MMWSIILFWIIKKKVTPKISKLLKKLRLTWISVWCKIDVGKTDPQAVSFAADSHWEKPMEVPSLHANVLQFPTKIQSMKWRVAQLQSTCYS